LNATLRVALLQLAPAGTEAAMADKAAAMAADAAAAGADIVVMPELYQLGYCALCPAFPRHAAHGSSGGGGGGNLSALYAWAARAQPDGDPNGYVARFGALAKSLGVAIQASFLRAAPGGGPPENAVALLDRHGELVHTYSKVHTAVWSQCEAMTAPGSAVRVGMLDTAGAGGVAVASLICADREYPEMPRLVAEAGAELLLVSNACDLTDWHLAMLRTRAFANGVAIGMANYAAPACNGRSPAYGPRGEQLALAADAAEQLVLFDVDVAALRAFRASPEGVARRKSMPQQRLCDPTKCPAFQRQNPLGRPAHSL